jgi:nitroimidazol reductase NimA-like FMN-containing flavoprotein (pyridoxamine 5'-phosphate oxidase superfamily)
MDREMKGETFPVTARTRLHRKPVRGSYDRAEAYAILDEALVCHAGFVLDGQPFVIPMVFARAGDRLILHGAPASRLLKAGAAGLPVCVTVTILDGLVLARSAMSHSMNYRSVMVLGHAVAVDDPAEKRAALASVVDHVVAGRSGEARPPNDKELAATLVLALPIEEASVKRRTGPPCDDEEDLSFPVWAGVVPLALRAAAPEPDPAAVPSLPVPAALVGYRR